MQAPQEIPLKALIEMLEEHRTIATARAIGHMTQFYNGKVAGFDSILDQLLIWQSMALQREQRADDMLDKEQKEDAANITKFLYDVANEYGGDGVDLWCLIPAVYYPAVMRHNFAMSYSEDPQAFYDLAPGQEVKISNVRLKVLPSVTNGEVQVYRGKEKDPIKTWPI